jgi:lipoprotein-anchoring transpeptidase ErfK/SrfK
MKKTILCLMASVACAMSAPAHADDRYQSRPPVIVSPDLAAPWLMQLGGQGVQRPRVYARQPQRAIVYSNSLYGRPMNRQPAAGVPVQQVAMQPQNPARAQIAPQFLPQTVSYQTHEKPGTIVIDTSQRFLYLVLDNGMARRYGVGVGKEGFGWNGTEHITRKAEWPQWNPPKEMIDREAQKGHYLPAHMEGGLANPLGARAMYLGSTLYRIHGTNAPWTIGNAVSSGCIRMRNEDVTDLYERVPVGTKVVVI